VTSNATNNRFIKWCAKCERETEQTRDANQALGIVVFLFTVLSCGMLSPITLPLTLYILLVRKPKSYCQVCGSANR
jgi:hypothetical protein